MTWQWKWRLCWDLGNDPQRLVWRLEREAKPRFGVSISKWRTSDVWIRLACKLRGFGLLRLIGECESGLLTRRGYWRECPMEWLIISDFFKAGKKRSPNMVVWYSGKLPVVYLHNGHHVLALPWPSHCTFSLSLSQFAHLYNGWVRFL